MADERKPIDSTFTVHSNFATMSYAGDQVIIEFRDYLMSHAEMFEKAGTSTGATGELVPPSMGDVYRIPPSARVVLTYASAKFILEWLSANLGTVDKNRKA